MTNADNIGPVNVAAAIARTTTTRGSVYGRRPVPVRESTTGSSSSHAPAYAMRKKNTSGCRDSTLRRASSGCRSVSGGRHVETLFPGAGASRSST